MIIDFHTHCFPEKIASRALENLSYVSGGLKYYTEGTVESLISVSKEQKIDKCVVLSIATNEKQQENVNNFAAEINKKDEIIAFGSIYPKAKNALDELERIKALGLKGIKLHPEYQNFYVDDELMKPIYKKISQLGLIVVFHSGLDLAYQMPFHCMPDNLLNALKWIDSPVIAAHWGASGCGEEVIEKLCGRDIYFDTSFGYSHMPKGVAKRIIEKHGTEKILFGTDAPWSTANRERRLLNSLELNESDLTNIYSNNAIRLLGL